MTITELALAAMHPPPGAPASAWATRISACWQASVKAILDVGRLLTEAKAALPHGDFGTMIESDLPFGARTAQMLMKIADDPRITNPKHASLLPPSWMTLHELTKLDDEQFEEAIKDGTLNPELERKDIATAVKQTARSKREVDLGAKQAALPQKKYSVIVADPEWRFEPWSRTTGMDRAADNHYPTSCTEVIAARDVPSISAPDCVLFLWATVPMLPHALLVMDAWGFDYRSHCAWIKDRIGMGYWFRNKHELLLVGIKGNIPAPAMGTQWESAQGPIAVGAHSQKPDDFLMMIERYFPTLPKIELNRRGPARPNWDCWGNEADGGSPTDPITGEISEAAE